MKRSGKAIVMLAAILLGLVFMFAVPVIEAKTQKITINFWAHWGSRTRRPIVEKMISDFNASQDRIFVKYTFLPWGDIWTKNLAAIAAGNPCDVIVNDINTVALRAQQKQNTNLTPYLKKEKENIKDWFFPQLWETTLYNNEPYAFPFCTDTRLLFYNKQHFAEVGLDPEKPPQTWAEFEAFAAKLDKVVDDRYVRVGGYPEWMTGPDFWMVTGDGGKNFVNAKGDLSFATPAKLEALDWIIKWRNRLGEKNVNSFRAGFGSQTANPFISGRLSMIIDIAGFYTQIRDYGQGMKYGIAPIPERSQGSGHYSTGGGFVLEIPYGSKHPKEAYEFIKYMANVDAQKYWGFYCYDMIANKKAAGEPELMAEPAYKAMVENMATTVLTPTPLFAPDFINLVRPQWEAAILGKASPREAMDKAQKDVENLIKQHKQ